MGMIAGLPGASILSKDAIMNIIVRESAPSDLPAITEIYQHAVVHGNASFEVDPPDITEMSRRREVILGGGYPYLVAERGGRAVGYSYAGAYRPRRAYRFAVENSIYVAPDQQGAGIGRLLLSELIKRLEAGGFRLIVAVIGDSANAASITLHARCGFTHAGLLPAVGWKHGRWLDSVLMTLPLGDGNKSAPV